jgi:hypothetical protein
VKVFYVSCIETNYPWGAEVFFNDALARLGVQTVCLDYRQHREELAQILAAQDWSSFDLFFLQRGDYFPRESIPRSLPSAFWASELVARNRDQDLLLRDCPFDHVFFHSSECAPEAQRRGLLGSYDHSVLVNGFAPQFHRPLGLARDIDVLHIGSMTDRRQTILAELQRQGLSVAVASSFGEEFVELVNRAKVVLNVHAEEQLDTETRIFEVLGCGSFIVSEPLSEDAALVGLQPGDGFVEVSGPAQMGEAVRYYLHHGEEREAIAARGHEAALARHSWYSRAEDVVRVFEGLVARQGRAKSPFLSWTDLAAGRE